MYRSHSTCSSCCFIFGLLLVIASGAIYCLREQLLRYIYSKALCTSPSMYFHDDWVKLPIPITTKFYFFNWSNPEEFSNNLSFPHVTELGPYTFKEFQNKVNITWNSNKTVSYMIHRKWNFDEKLSARSPEDVVTTLNIVPAVGAYFMRGRNYYLNRATSLMFSTVGHKIFTKRSIRELMFDGYSDPLISLAWQFMYFEYEKFGYFFKFNDTSKLDGFLNVATGEDDISQVAVMKNWNYKRNYSCSTVDGTTAEQFRPGLDKTNITVFSPWMCRMVYMNYINEVSVKGITGYKYAAGEDNLKMDSETGCSDETMYEPPGVINISACHFDGPLFISYPHFYKSDPYYRDQVMGMKPNASSHESYIVIEPTLGIPLEGKIRLQLNILIDAYPHIRMYQKIPRMFFPIFWVEKSVIIPPYHAKMVKIMLWFPKIIEIFSIFLMVVGVLLSVGIYLRYCNIVQTITLEHSITKSYLKRKRSCIPLENTETMRRPLMDKECYL